MHYLCDGKCGGYADHDFGDRHYCSGCLAGAYLLNRGALHNLKQRLDTLHEENARLVRERDVYDKRRREAMVKCEEWRMRCWELEGKKGE